MTRTLQAPKVRGAWLPYGPAVKPPAAPLALQVGESKDGDDARTNQELAQDFKGFLELLEKELVLIAGLEGVDAEKHQGRAAGPQYAWVDQSKCETAGPSRTTSVSRAWRRTAGWLADISRTTKVGKAEAARWQVLRYEHPVPDQTIATPEQLRGMSTFTAWRATLAERNVFSAAWVELFHRVAIK